MSLSVGTAVCVLRRPVREGCSRDDGDDDNDDDSGLGWQREEKDDCPDSAGARRAEVCVCVWGVVPCGMSICCVLEWGSLCSVLCM